MYSRFERRARALAVGVAALGLTLAASAGTAAAAPGHTEDQHGHDHGRSTYQQINLVADTAAGRAKVIDPKLVNPWGVSYGPTSPLWVSNAGTGTSTLYSGGIHGGTQTINPLVVKIPGGVPTGQVFNPTTDFVVKAADGSSGSSRFLFVGPSGHLSGWAPTVPPPVPSTNAQDAVVTPGAAFTGLAFASTSSGSRLYSADFSAGTVDVFKGTLQRVITSDNFEDRRLPRGYSPFNVAVLGGKLYVAYAKIDRSAGDEVKGRGLGRVDVFTLDGTLLRRLSPHSGLNAPWGLTVAPAGFGAFSGDLLVGNFGDGRIHAYDPTTLRYQGILRNEHRRPVAIDGLWSLIPGNGVEGGTDEVLFTAGPDDETHGLLGSLSVHK